MKKAVIFLGVLLAVLLAVMWRNQQRASHHLQQASMESSSLSNLLATAEMKLNHQERMNAALNSQLTNQIVALKHSADQVSGVHHRLAQAQADLLALRNQLQTAHAATESAKAEAAGSAAQMEKLQGELRDKDNQVAKARAQSADVESARQLAAQQLAGALIENDKLNQQLRNPSQLRARLAALENRLAAARHSPSDSAPADLKLNLELQPDGSVRVSPPPTTQELQELEKELRAKLRPGQ